MAASDTEIANLALLHLGHTVEIGSLATTRTEAAYVMRRLYDTVRRATLRDHAWPFAHKVGALGLVSTYGVDASHPTSEWKFVYRMPSDSVRFIKIQSGIRNDTRQSEIKFKVSRDASGWVIFTDAEDAIGEWTIDIESVEMYPDDFVLAFSLRLAAYAAPKICGEDPFRMGERSMNLYMKEIDMARANGMNEMVREEEPEPEAIRART